MKLYSSKSTASISFGKNEKLKSLLREIDGINYIVETGTYLGTSSTSVLADIFGSKKDFKVLYTCEADWYFYENAKRNLSRYPFVTCLYGLSIAFAEARDFITVDEAILNHNKVPDVYIDDIRNPLQFYLNELDGKLSNHNYTIKDKIKKILKKKEDGILNRLLPSILGFRNLIVLDSAGGIGYLEFKKVIEILKNEEFYLLLDDIDHLKHFRSFNYIKSSENFKVLGEDLIEGWVLAKYYAAGE